MTTAVSFGQMLRPKRAPTGAREDLALNLPVHPGRTGAGLPLDEALFRALIDSRLVAVAITSPDKRWLKVNDKWCEMIGYSRQELASLDWADITHPDDLAPDFAQFKRLVSGEIQDYVLEKRFVRKNGQILYAEISISAMREADGALRCAVGLGIDTSQRKQAEQCLAEMTAKLIEAQEQERARIGRELHDDIGQRLALLAMDIDLLRSNPSRMPRGLRNLRTQVDEISRDLQSLSHDLHAAKLEYLGAIRGIKSWCIDFASRYKVQIGFRSDVGTSLPGPVGICLFRVVQEALQNVVKHSGTDRAEVIFAERANEVRLVIRDEGRGFDKREVRSGLGLISMRERVRIIDGTLTIESGLMRGTSIVVRVPLRPNRKLRVVAGKSKRDN